MMQCFFSWLQKKLKKKIKALPKKTVVKYIKGEGISYQSFKKGVLINKYAKNVGKISHLSRIFVCFAGDT